MRWPRRVGSRLATQRLNASPAEATRSSVYDEHRDRIARCGQRTFALRTASESVAMGIVV
jgi:hypothetical protein